MNASNANILFVCIENHGAITGLLQGDINVQERFAETL